MSPLNLSDLTLSRPSTAYCRARRDLVAVGSSEGQHGGKAQSSQEWVPKSQAGDLPNDALGFGSVLLLPPSRGAKAVGPVVRFRHSIVQTANQTVFHTHLLLGFSGRDKSALTAAHSRPRTPTCSAMTVVGCGCECVGRGGEQRRAAMLTESICKVAVTHVNTTACMLVLG